MNIRSNQNNCEGDFEAQLREEAERFAIPLHTIPTVQSLRQTMRYRVQKRRQRFAALACVAVAAVLIGRGMENGPAGPAESRSTAAGMVASDQTTLVPSVAEGPSPPKNLVITVRRSDRETGSPREAPFRAHARWTVAVPVMYREPKTRDWVPSWTFEEFSMPIDPDSLSNTERSSAYRVLHQEPAPMRIEF